MGQREEVFIIGSRLETARIIWGLWRPYGPGLGSRLPATSWFVRAIAENIEPGHEEVSSFESLGGNAALAELSLPMSWTYLGINEAEQAQLEFALGCIAKLIEAEAACHKATLVTKSANRVWSIWGQWTDLGPRTVITNADDEEAVAKLREGGLELKKSLEGDLAGALKAEVEVANEMRQAGRPEAG